MAKGFKVPTIVLLIFILPFSIQLGYQFSSLDKIVLLLYIIKSNKSEKYLN